MPFRTTGVLDVRAVPAPRRSATTRSRVARRPGGVRELQPRLGTNLCPGGVVPTTTFTGNTVTGASGSRAACYVRPTRSVSARTVTSRLPRITTRSPTTTTVCTSRRPGAATTTVAANRNSHHRQHAVGCRQHRDHDRRRHLQLVGSGVRVPAAGEAIGPVTAAPWLIASNLNGNCLPVVKIGTPTSPSPRATPGPRR